MSIESTNRIIDPKKEIKKSIRDSISHNYSLKRKPLFQSGNELSKCSVCKHNMKKSMADEQIKNKRENAPICMACIMGYSRKDKTEKMEYLKKCKENIKKGVKFTGKREQKSDRKKEIDLLFNR